MARHLFGCLILVATLCAAQNCYQKPLDVVFLVDRRVYHQGFSVAQQLKNVYAHFHGNSASYTANFGVKLFQSSSGDCSLTITGETQSLIDPNMSSDEFYSLLYPSGTDPSSIPDRLPAYRDVFSSLKEEIKHYALYEKNGDASRIFVVLITTSPSYDVGSCSTGNTKTEFNKMYMESFGRGFVFGLEVTDTFQKNFLNELSKEAGRPQANAFLLDDPSTLEHNLISTLTELCGCGNQQLNSGEECDFDEVSGHAVSYDGCSESCKFEYPKVSSTQQQDLDEDTSITFDVLTNVEVPNGVNSYTALPAKYHSSFRVVTQPIHSSMFEITVNPHSVKYKPQKNYVGDDSFTYEICFAQTNTHPRTGGCIQDKFYLHIQPVNDPPEINDDPSTGRYEVFEGQSTDLDVLFNDHDLESQDQFDLESLRVTQPPALGSVERNGRYLKFTAPGVSRNEDVEFIYTISDGDKDNPQSGHATVKLTVLDLPDDPVCVDDTITGTEDTAIVFDVLANDSHQTISSFSIVRYPLSGGDIDATDRSNLVFTPLKDYHGTDRLMYKVCDDHNRCCEGLATIIVAPVNDQPIAVDDLKTINENTIVVIDVLENDMDVDGYIREQIQDRVTILENKIPQAGVFEMVGGSLMRFTPKPFYHGLAVATYKICDSDICSEPAAVRITIRDIQHRPIAVTDISFTNATVSKSLDVIANDEDDDQDVLTLTRIVNPPSSGEYTIAGNVITYTPNLYHDGEDRLEYLVCDPAGLCDRATWVITTEPQNDAPALIPNYNPDVEETSKGFEFLLRCGQGSSVRHSPLTEFYDPDITSSTQVTGKRINPLSLQITKLPKNGVASLSSSIIKYVPDPGSLEDDVVEYKLCDDYTTPACINGILKIDMKDTVPPTVSWVAEEFTATVPVEIEAMFSEPVDGFDNADIVSGVTVASQPVGCKCSILSIDAVEGSNRRFVLRLNATCHATCTLVIEENVAHDSWGNPNTQGDPLNVLYGIEINEQKSTVGLVVGLVFGLTLAICLAVVGIWYFKRYRNLHKVVRQDIKNMTEAVDEVYEDQEFGLQGRFGERQVAQNPLYQKQASQAPGDVALAMKTMDLEEQLVQQEEQIKKEQLEIDSGDKQKFKFQANQNTFQSSAQQRHF